MWESQYLQPPRWNKTCVKKLEAWEIGTKIFSVWLSKGKQLSVWKYWEVREIEGSINRDSTVDVSLHVVSVSNTEEISVITPKKAIICFTNKIFYAFSCLLLLPGAWQTWLYLFVFLLVILTKRDWVKAFSMRLGTAEGVARWNIFDNDEFTVLPVIYEKDIHFFLLRFCCRISK